TLLDQALTPDASVLHPRLLSASVLYALTDDVSLVLRADAGGRSSRTTSIAQPSTPAADLSQRTTLRIRLQSTLGAQFTALRWHGRTSTPMHDHLRLQFGGGGGVVSYQLDQRGTFVDAARSLAYGAAYRSVGTGGVAYATSSLEIPVQRLATISASLRRQWGSARMTQDYATFDRLDFGGTTASVGLVLHPFGGGR
ncbi:MAG TPA: hypothetical protein VE861_02310, partial [Gemmatimonadaceae bacterium]|nr:hypothetical protein [Gemmatimonadaceae bacterium]